MEQIMNYVKPELIVVAVVLYLIGIGLKKAGAVPDKYIPLLLGGIGIVLCAVWVLATSPLKGVQDISMGCIYSGNTGDPCGGTEHLCRIRSSSRLEKQNKEYLPPAERPSAALASWNLVK